jgi:hypothetical protein
MQKFCHLARPMCTVWRRFVEEYDAPRHLEPAFRASSVALKEICVRYGSLDSTWFGSFNFMTKRKRFRLGFLVLLLLPGGLSAETLVPGAVYYDSYPSFLQAQHLLAARDTQGLGEMIRYSHVSDPLPAGQNIKVIQTPDLGKGPNDPIEFCFTDSQTTYWTMQKFVAGQPSATPSPASKSTAAPEFVPRPSPTPLPTMTPTSIPEPTPKATPTPTPATKKDEPAPFDDRGGTIRWHKVNGIWKWYPVDPSKFKGVKPRTKPEGDDNIQPDGSRRLIPPE